MDVMNRGSRSKWISIIVLILILYHYPALMLIKDFQNRVVILALVILHLTMKPIKTNETRGIRSGVIFTICLLMQEIVELSHQQKIKEIAAVVGLLLALELLNRTC